MPGKCHPAYDDPRKVLQSRVFHAFAFIVLHKAVHGHDVSDHVIALTLYLLEMALSIDTPAEEPSQVCLSHVISLFCKGQHEIRH